MTSLEMTRGRKRLGWTQQTAASKLGVSQPYLSLLEAGDRRLPVELVEKAVELYSAPPTFLPLDESFHAPSAQGARQLTEELAGLGYPGFSHYRPKGRHNPAAVLFNALGQSDLESRLVEALPWVVLRYPNLNWEWLVPRVKTNSLQNRLGFVTCLAQKLAANHTTDDSTETVLAEQQSKLESARLAVESTLCHDSLTAAERAWLRTARTPDAAHWNLLTDLRPEHLQHV